METCHDHTGCLRDIANLGKEAESQWEAIAKVNSRIDTMMNRLNVILGGVVVACILLAINILMKTV
jgi:hypothetical protein